MAKMRMGRILGQAMFPTLESKVNKILDQVNSANLLFEL